MPERMKLFLLPKMVAEKLQQMQKSDTRFRERK
jgi:hypothetical protein